MTASFAVQCGAHPVSERGVDFYQTPRCAVEALLQTGELTSKNIWDPACGLGAISDPLSEAGYNVTATDRYDHGGPYTTGEEWDFLAPKKDFGWAESYTIVTNPPFMYADAFIQRALEYSPKAVMLLRWAYAEGVNGGNRRDGLRSINIDQHCTRVWLGRERLPFMHREGWTGKKNSSSAAPFAWFVFEREKQHPGFHVQRMSWRVGQSGKAKAEDQDNPKPAALRAV